MKALFIGGTGSLIGDKAVSVVFDNTKLKRLAPEMTTRVPFHRGVRIALDYILSHPGCQQEDKEFDEWCDRVIAAQEAAKKWYRRYGSEEERYGSFGTVEED